MQYAVITIIPFFLELIHKIRRHKKGKYSTKAMIHKMLRYHTAMHVHFHSHVISMLERYDIINRHASYHSFMDITYYIA